LARELAWGYRAGVTIVVLPKRVLYIVLARRIITGRTFSAGRVPAEED